MPLRPCDSRTLTEQTLGRGLRKVHRPEIDEDGAVDSEPEPLYVIEHPSFKAIIDQLGDIIEVRESPDITHTREYVAVPKKPVMEERRAGSVRLVRFLGLVEEVPDWRKRFDLNTVPDLDPRLPWRDEVSRVDIRTYLKEALKEAETEGPRAMNKVDLPKLIDQRALITLLKALWEVFVMGAGTIEAALCQSEQFCYDELNKAFPDLMDLIRTDRLVGPKLQDLWDLLRGRYEQGVASRFANEKLIAQVETTTIENLKNQGTPPPSTGTTTPAGTPQGTGQGQTGQGTTGQGTPGPVQPPSPKPRNRRSEPTTTNKRRTKPKK